MAAAKHGPSMPQLIRDFMRQTVERQHNAQFRDDLRQDVSNSSAAMCFMTWSNLLPLHGGMK